MRTQFESVDDAIGVRIKVHEECKGMREREGGEGDEAKSIEHAPHRIHFTAMVNIE
jgi:hypothetical protein